MEEKASRLRHAVCHIMQAQNAAAQVWQLAKAHQLDGRERPADISLKVCQVPKHCQAGNRGRCHAHSPCSVSATGMLASPSVCSCCRYTSSAQRGATCGGSGARPRRSELTAAVPSLRCRCTALPAAMALTCTGRYKSMGRCIRGHESLTQTRHKTQSAFKRVLCHHVGMHALHVMLCGVHAPGLWSFPPRSQGKET